MLFSAKPSWAWTAWASAKDLSLEWTALDFFFLSWFLLLFLFLRKGARWASHFHWLIKFNQFPIASASYHREMIRFSVLEERCEKTLTTKKMPLVKYVIHYWFYAQEVPESWNFCLFDANASEPKSTWSISKLLIQLLPTSSLSFNSCLFLPLKEATLGAW